MTTTRTAKRRTSSCHVGAGCGGGLRPCDSCGLTFCALHAQPRGAGVECRDCDRRRRSAGVPGGAQVLARAADAGRAFDRLDALVAK